MKNNKKIFILVLLLVIGFASVSATLVITGVLGVSTKKSDFIVKFTNAKLGEVERKDFINADDPKLLDYTIENVTEVGVATTLNYEVTNTSRVYDAEVSVTCNIVDNDGNPTTSEYISMDYTPKEKLTIRAGKTESGSITTTLIKSSTTAQSINVRCELKAEATERTSLGEEYKEAGTYEIVTDTNNNGVADIGDEIKVGTESFYVISNNSSELNALAKYNLNVGSSKDTTKTEGIQQPGGNFGVKFSNNSGWDNTNNATINIKDYDGPVKTALYGEDGESGYQSYIREFISNATVRLITKSDIEKLLNKTTPITSTYKLAAEANAKGYSWLYSTNYWTQSAKSGYGNTSYVLLMFSEGILNYRDYYQVDIGVRPVITIALS